MTQWKTIMNPYDTNEEVVISDSGDMRYIKTECIGDLVSDTIENLKSKISELEERIYKLEHPYGI